MKTKSTFSSSYYDSIAEEYDTLFLDTLSEAENRLVESDLRNIIEKIGKQKIKIFDLGCGTGLALELIERIKNQLGVEIEYYGIDISPKMIEIARSKYDGIGITFFPGDMGELPDFIKQEKFDLILSLFGSFSHCDKAKELVDKLYNDLLAKKGTMYLMTYSRFSIKNIYSFIKKIDFKKLSFIQQYNIRNSKLGISCKAFFYTPNSIRKILPNPMKAFYNVSFKTINGVFEVPFFKRVARMLNIRSIFAILKMERKLLRFVPFFGHSLISIIEKE